MIKKTQIKFFSRQISVYKIIISWFQFTSTFGCKAYQCQISGRIGWLGKSPSWTFGPYFELAINITSRTQNCIASSRSFAQHLFPVPKSHDSSFPRNSSYFKLIRYFCIFSLVLTKKYSFILFLDSFQLKPNAAIGLIKGAALLISNMPYDR